ncbi:putative N-acetylglucosaminyl-diphospho-decaprenol L-rhamnosyltransferase [Nannochloris sp. 'desiccata']|nr:hypothetical protein KSW81_006084 [Chlorella desiccata (nom. nud.)]KAH7621101.1 putative N-acetylglucosaminyl-diphospho-decaprenol L-rhamnosyltransferase [Chlorella desiccata (nom. nud.)]
MAGGSLSRAQPAQQPALSVIMTVHNNVAVAAQALLEIFIHSQEVESMEYIVVDDEAVLFYKIGYNPVFLRRFMPCRLVTKGAMALLKSTLDTNPSIAAVGPMFVGDNHVIQEAGGIVFNDASAMNAGRGADLSRFLHRVRQVDYISAACLMVRNKLFWKAGGFDMRYGKGYYEDTDLAMALREAGWQVVLQPFAVVYHQEGGVFGSDSVEKTQLMVENRAKFQRKWEIQLQNHCPPNTGLMATARFTKGAIAVIDELVPEPDRDSGSQRAYLLFKALLEFNFTVVLYTRFPGHIKYQMEMQNLGGVIMPANSLVVDLHFLREARDHLSQDRNFENLSISNIARWIDQGEGATAERIRAVRNQDLALFDAANATIVLSPVEAYLLNDIYSINNKADILSNIYELSKSSPSRVTLPCEKTHGALFVGNFIHPPNRQAMKYLLAMLPSLLGALPPKEQETFILHIVSSNLPKDFDWGIDAFLLKKVRFHSGISRQELEHLYRFVRLAIAPLLSGAGVKGKVAEAWLMGVPIIVSPIAAEGMLGFHNQDFLIANNTDQFHYEFQRLYMDCNLREQLIIGGKSVLKQFSYRAAKPRILGILSGIGVQRRNHCFP